MHLILASGSPRRRDLLADAGYRFDIVTPASAVECGTCSNTGPVELVADLALRKAADVVSRAGPQTADRATVVVIAADTVAECQGQILGKPHDEEHARQMLQLLSGRLHRVYTGLCVWPLLGRSGSPDSSACRVEVDTTTLRMDKLSSAQIDEYLASGGWKGKAGAFGYQDRLGWVHIVQGSETNVVGLPMELLRRMLAVVE